MYGFYCQIYQGKENWQIANLAVMCIVTLVVHGCICTSHLTLNIYTQKLTIFHTTGHVCIQLLYLLILSPTQSLVFSRKMVSTSFTKNRSTERELIDDNLCPSRWGGCWVVLGVLAPTPAPSREGGC